jgi:photosystem II stability/assembly factor-like uncharacterized protein
MIHRLLGFLAASSMLAVLPFGAWAASVPIDDWKITGPFGGTATSIAVDPKNPKLVLAGARNSLLYQSQDAGATWELLNLPKRVFGEVTSILVDPLDSQHYFAAMIATENPGLFESKDAGRTWAPVKDIGNVGVQALAVSASEPTHFVAGTLRGVMLSTDSGKSWTRISDPENLEMLAITAVAIDTEDPNTIYAGTTHLPWRTKDGGKTWQSINTGMIDDSDVFSIYIDPTAPQSVFAGACSGIYSSANRGDIWHKLNGIPNTHRRTHVIRKDPSQIGTVYAGTTLGLFKSVDRGGTWRAVNSNQVNALAFDPSQPESMYLALEYEGIGKSHDRGETMKPSVEGFVNRRISTVTVAGGRFLAIETQEGNTTGLFASEDRGETWHRLTNVRGLEGVHLRSIVGLSSEDRIVLGASPRHMFKSIDGGLTWKAMPIRLQAISYPYPTKQAVTPRAKSTPSRRVGTVRPITREREVNASEISSLYATKSGTKDLIFAATDLGLLKTTDMGEHWVLLDLPGTTAVNALFTPANSNGRLIARAAASLYISKDFGDHWEQLFFPKPTSEVNEVAVPTDPAGPLLVAAHSGLWSSSDSGATWVLITTGLPISTVSSVIYSPNQTSVAYAVEYGRLYQSKDFGTSWTAVPSGLSSLRIRQLWIPDKTTDRLYGITNDLGILFRNEALIR